MQCCLYANVYSKGQEHNKKKKKKGSKVKDVVCHSGPLYTCTDQQ